MSGMVIVGIADLNIVKAPGVLVTYALGSCVGICLYDPVSKVAGLSHIMLPASSMSGSPVDAKQAMKFADTGVIILKKKMEMAGANSAMLKAKIAGGAQMFASMNNSSVGNIGQRNVQAVKHILGQLRIPIIAEDTGKDYGRTLYFSSADGVMKIKSVNHGEFTY